MASNINPLNINGSYPIAGQDNDSQGFRDNFTNIRTNLTFAKAELEDLQSKAIFKTPLIGTTAVANDFNGTLLTGATTKAFTQTVYNHVTVTGTIVLDWTNGDFQVINQIPTGGGHISLSFANSWPAGTTKYASMRLLVRIANTNTNLTIAGCKIYAGAVTPPTDIVLTIPPGHTANKDFLFEFSTYDGGNTVIMVPLITPL